MKRKSRMSIIPAVLAGLGVLILSGCFNPLTLSPEQEEDAVSAGGGVTIRVSGKPEAARTLYPLAEFSKIVLSFTPKSSQPAYADVTLTSGNSSVVLTNLTDGNWDVSAKGFVEIDADGNGSIGGGEEFEAASSSAVSFTVSSGSSVVDITLSAGAITSSTPGYFSYSVTFPAEKVDTASLSFMTANGGSAHDSSGTYIDQKNLTSDPNGTISLVPGYYLVRIELQNSYQRAGRTEIVHIYPNMETRADYSFTAADFTDFIVLSGTVDIKINGSRPSYAQVNAYKLSNGSRVEQLGSCSVQWDGDSVSTGTWKIGILPSSSPQDVGFWVSNTGGGNTQWESGVTRTVSNANVMNIPITINKQTLTLSGTAAVTVNGASFGGGAGEYVSVRLYDGDGANNVNRNQIGYGSVYFNDGTWSMVIEKPASSATYYIDLDAWTNDGSVNYTKRNLQSIYVSDIDIPNITLSHNFTVLSGTVNLTVNGSPLPGGKSMSVSLSSKPDGSGQEIGYTNAGADGSWSMALDDPPLSGTYYFRVSTYNSGGGATEYWNPNVHQISFPLGSYSGIAITHNFIVLSGTANITVNNGSPPAGTQVAVYLSSDPGGDGRIGWADLNAGTWSMSLYETPTTGITYYFGVGIRNSGGGGSSLYFNPNVGTIIFPPASYSGITISHNFQQ
jgi:hypothetical protein